MLAETLPPHSVEAEEAVIGSLLIDGETPSSLKVVSSLNPADFYRERARFCFEAARALFHRNEAINQVTVAHELAAHGRLEPVGGHGYLSHLVASVPTPVAIEHYARIVRDTAILRRLVTAGEEIYRLGHDESRELETILRKAEDTLFRVRSGQGPRDFVPIGEVLDRYLEESSLAPTAPLEMGIAPIYTGFAKLDELLGGLQRSDLIVGGARPSRGKSALALNIARNAASDHSTHVGIFSLEMSKEQLAQRLLASESGVDSRRLRLGLYTEGEKNRIMDAIGVLSELPIFIDDSSSQSIVEMRGKARRLQLEKKLDLLIVDYLQLIVGEGRRPENRVQEMSEISRSIKAMARDLEVPVLALSQLSRAPEGRPSHRPQLSDLRESGSIEQDADVVMFIHRDDLDFTEEEWSQRNPALPYPRNQAEIMVSKHRNGPVGSVTLFFRDNLVRFEDMKPEVEGI